MLLDAGNSVEEAQRIMRVAGELARIEVALRNLAKTDDGSPLGKTLIKEFEDGKEYLEDLRNGKKDKRKPDDREKNFEPFEDLASVVALIEKVDDKALEKWIEDRNTDAIEKLAADVDREARAFLAAKHDWSVHAQFDLPTRFKGDPIK